MQYIFLDTNIFIHFIDFEQIPWEEIVESKDQIILIIAPIVIQELDKQKYNKNQKISKRVKKVLPKIENILERKINSKYLIESPQRKPSQNIFVEFKLDEREQDDNLLCSILDFIKTIKVNDRIIYITNDVGPRLKARSLKIITKKLPDNYLITEEQDENEIKINSLQKELNELKHRMPKLSMAFSNKENHYTYKRSEFKYSKELFIREKLEKEKINTPYLAYNQPDNNQVEGSINLLLNSSLFKLSEEQVTEYNAELQDYYLEYESYLESLFSVLNTRANSIIIELLLINTGTAPANDIDIEMHFPDGFELIIKDDFPTINPKPRIPYKPQSRYDFRIPSLNPIMNSIINPSNKITSNLPNISFPTIKKTNSYEVTYSVNKLKHNQIYILESLYAVFDDINKAKSFAIDYKLIVSNLPNIIYGQLHVKL